MTTQQDTRSIAKRFFEAWASKDAGAVRSLTADAIEFENPIRVFRGADQFIGPFMGFAATVRSAPVIDILVEGDRATILFDCNMAEPIGKLKTAWFLNVQAGKVQKVQSLFDATEVRKVVGGEKKG